MSLIAMLPEKLWRLARLTLNRLVLRIRQQKPSGASIDRVIDVEQARERARQVATRITPSKA